MKRLIFKIATWLRCRFVLELVRMVQDVPLLGRIQEVFDPNEMRKNVTTRFNERLYLLRKPRYQLWVNLNDHIGYRSFLDQRPFEMAVYQLAKILGLGPDSTILDIGANIGTASVPICAELDCELIAVEASKGNADLLVRNIFENRVRAKTHLVALTRAKDADEYLPLYVQPGNTGANSLKKEWSSSQVDTTVEWVPIATLDEIISNSEARRIQLVKIDVEGAELEVLQGGKAFFARCQAPILFEFRRDAMERYLDDDGGDLIAFFEKTHVLRAFSDGVFEGFDPKRSYENVVAIPLGHSLCEQNTG